MKTNNWSRALKGRGESLSPLQGSIVLDNLNQGRRCACPWLPYSAPSALPLGVSDEEQNHGRQKFQNRERFDRIIFHLSFEMTPLDAPRSGRRR